MFSRKDLTYASWLLLAANAVNILFLVVRIFGVVTVRPYILYDYLIVPFLILLRLPSILVWVSFVCILLTDLLMQLSFIYLFNLPDFVNNLTFFSLYDLSWSHYLMIGLLVLFITSIFFVVRKMTVPVGVSRTTIASILVAFAVIVYTMDFFNGKTLANEGTIAKVNRANWGAALIRDFYILVKDFTVSSTKPTLRAQPSITFETFERDTGSQLLIILESWGLPAKGSYWQEIQKILGEQSQDVGWQVEFGDTPFKGSTIQAELRELFNVSGDYHYFLRPDSGRTLRSIFDVKKQQGYITYAIHSFTGQMFQRNAWWKTIGIDTVYFMENLVRLRKISTGKLNYESPFTSLNDEDAFRFINAKGFGTKHFAYFLTVNTHLPYSPGSVDIKHRLTIDSISDEARDQLDRILDLLIFFIVESSKKEWSQVLIVGDHMPPFTRESDRNFYNSKRVPYLILKK